MKLTRLPLVAPLALATALAGCGEKEIVPPHDPPDSEQGDDSDPPPHPAPDDTDAQDSPHPAPDDTADTAQAPHPAPDDTAAQDTGGAGGPPPEGACGGGPSDA